MLLILRITTFSVIFWEGILSIWCLTKFLTLYRSHDNMYSCHYNMLNRKKFFRFLWHIISITVTTNSHTSSRDFYQTYLHIKKKKKVSVKFHFIMTWKTLTRVRQLKAGFTEHHMARITSCALRYYFVSLPSNLY